MKYFFQILILSAFLGCKTETPDEPATAEISYFPQFQLHEGFKGENYSCVSLYPTDNQLLVLGENFVATLDTSHKLISSTTFSNQREVDTWTKMNTNGVYFTHYLRNRTASWHTKVMVRSVARPNLSVEIDVQKVDTNFRLITLNSDLSAGLLTQENQLFLPVIYSKDAQNYLVRGECRLISFRLQTIGDRLTAVLDPLSYALSITPPNFSVFGVRNLFRARPNDPHIYLSSYSTYRLDLRTGIHEPLFDIGSAQYGFTNDTLWAFGQSEQTRNLGFAFLPPNKSEWTSFSTNTTYGQEYWCFADKHILPIYQQSHIAHFTTKLDSGKFTIQSLGDNNIRNIRDLVRFKNRVYIATSQGLLSKPLWSLIFYPPK